MVCQSPSEGCIDRTLNKNEIQESEQQKNKRQLLKKRGRKRAGSRVVRSSAKKQIVHGEAFRLPLRFLVLMFCLRLGDASPSMEETFSSSSSAVIIAAQSSGTDVALSSVAMMEEEGSSGSAMERATSAANGAAVDVTSPNRNVLNAFDALATATIEMEMCRQQTVQLEKQHQHLRL